MKNLPNLMVITLVLAVVASAAQCADDDLAFIQQRVRQNKEMIHSIDCTFEIVPTNISKTAPDDFKNHTVTVRWRQKGALVRWDISSDWKSLNQSYLWKDGIRKAIASQTPTGGKSTNTGSFLASADVERDIYSPWINAAYYLQTPKQPSVYAFLENKDAKIAMKRIAINGIDGLELTGNDGLDTTRITLDPARNHSVIRIVAEGPLRTERDVTNLKEFAPGLYFPQDLEYRAYKFNKLYYSCGVHFKNVQINEEIDASQFELTFPEGLSVVDNPKGTIYETGPNESVVPRTERPIPLSKDQQDALDAQRPWYKRLNYWLAITAGVLVLVLAVVLIKRNGKAPAATT